MIYTLDISKKLAAPSLRQTCTLADLNWKEDDLRDHLFAHHTQYFSESIWLIGKSRPGQETADLLGLDANGDLWIFELKRWISNAENLLQSLRYSQVYSNYTYEDWNRVHKFFHPNSLGLLQDFCARFRYPAHKHEQLLDRIGRKHHLVVVTDGNDQKTLSAISHWRNQGINIHPWPYRVYKHASQTQFEFELPSLFVDDVSISAMPTPVIIINTNRANRMDAEQKMLQEQVALATESPWVDQIEAIPAGARVLLYANGEGVIACGVASAVQHVGDLNGSPYRSVELREFTRTNLTFNDIKHLYPGFIPNSTKRTIGDPHGDLIWDAAVLQRVP